MGNHWDQEDEREWQFDQLVRRRQLVNEEKTMTEETTKKKRGRTKDATQKLEEQRDKYEAEVAKLQAKRDSFMESVRIIDMAMKGAIAARDAFRAALKAQAEVSAEPAPVRVDIGRPGRA